MIKLNSKQWKSIPLSQTVSDSNYSNLISIEEINDYETLENELNEVKSSPDSSGTLENQNSKKRKKNQQRKQKKNKKLKNSPPNQVVSVINVIKENEEDEKLKSMHAWSSFNIPDPVLKAMADKGFTAPTEIQSLCLVDAMFKKKDILGAAETGSGKTLAFGIPIVTGILEYIESSGNEHELNLKLWALIVAPTRELVIQVKTHLQDLCKYVNIQVLDIIGGLSIEKQNRKLLKRPHIVVGTPGRLWQLINGQNEFLSSQVDNIRYLVVDEADRMMEKLHFSELQCLLERLNNSSTKRRQTFIFSATLTMVHEPPNYVTKKKKKNQTTRITPGIKLQSFISLVGANKPTIIDITKENVVASGVNELCVQCLVDEKDLYLMYILKTEVGKKIIFCNSINFVRRLADLLSILKINPLPLFADMAQKQRLKNLERFQNNANTVLLATDVAARGLDIPKVELVIHYHVPKTSEIYVHRSGRTARGKNQGTSILMCSPPEVVHYGKIKQNLGKGEFPSYDVKATHMLNAFKKQMNLAHSILDLKTRFKKITDNSNWIEKCAKEMDLLLDDDEVPEKLDNEEQKQFKRQIQSMTEKLKNLMSQPILPYSVSPRYPSYNVNKILR